MLKEIVLFWFCFFTFVFFYFDGGHQQVDVNRLYLRGVEWVHGLFLFPLVLMKL